MDNKQNTDLLDLTVGMVTAFLENNQIAADQVPALISSIHAALGSVGSAAVEEEAPVRQMTAAQARKLITPAGIVSMIDGRPFKSMKRHVGIHGYTPETYRSAFGLPVDFPMVHPDYSAARSSLALAMGLGSGGRKPNAAPKMAPKTRAKKAG